MGPPRVGRRLRSGPIADRPAAAAVLGILTVPQGDPLGGRLAGGETRAAQRVTSPLIAIGRPQHLNVAVSGSVVTLTWPAPERPVGITGYRVGDSYSVPSRYRSATPSG